MSNETPITELVKAVKSFFPVMQLKTVLEFIDDVEDDDWETNRDYCMNVLAEFKDTFEQMPMTGQPEIDEEGSDIPQPPPGEAVAYLHYFVGGCDWWITEKDCEEEQFQAFGAVRLNSNEPELGYISIDELKTMKIPTSMGIPIGVELDFHWEPTKLKDIPELKDYMKKYSRK